MTDVPAGKAARAAEVRQRLRLARVTSALSGASVHVVPAGDDDAADVLIFVSPPDADIAAHVRALTNDLMVRIDQGLWRRR